MSDYDKASSYAAGSPVRDPNQKAGRVDHDIDRIATLTKRLNVTTERITRLARSLGYYEPQPASTGQAPTPVSTTLQDVLIDLERAVETNCSSLNLFD